MDELEVLKGLVLSKESKNIEILDFEQAGLIVQNKMIDLNPNMPVITLNINGQSVSIKRQNCQAGKTIQPYAVYKKCI